MILANSMEISFLRSGGRLVGIVRSRTRATEVFFIILKKQIDALIVKFPGILWKQEVHYHVHKSPPFESYKSSFSCPSVRTFLILSCHVSSALTSSHSFQA
jgi:hypothetical protein